MKKGFASLMVLMMCSVLVAPSARAASPWTEAEGYGNQVADKLVFGAKNALFGWTEVFAAPSRAHHNDGNVSTAVGEGLVNAVVYTLGGALHLVTFFAPQIDIPLPDNGVPLKDS